MLATSPLPGTQPTDTVQAAFLALLPRIEQQARLSFRFLRCAHRREDAVAETIALAWLWFGRLTARGKDPSEFVTVLASFATRAVRNGRRLCGMERTKDALSPTAQKRRGFGVEPLGEGSPSADPYQTALQDNACTPVPEQVVFRCDFPRWRLTLCERDRRLVDELVLGERTQDVAKRFGLTPGRVSQLRRQFHGDWEVFCGEPAKPLGQPEPA